MKSYRRTLDLDSNDKALIFRVVLKILRCPCHITKRHLSASMNGYHIEFWCEKDCDVCRLVFDDARRCAADMTNRAREERDVLFCEKAYFKMGSTLVLHK